MAAESNLATQDSQIDTEGWQRSQPAQHSLSRDREKRVTVTVESKWIDHQDYKQSHLTTNGTNFLVFQPDRTLLT